MNMNNNRYMGVIGQGHVQAPQVNAAPMMIQREHLGVMSQSYLSTPNASKGKKMLKSKNSIQVKKSDVPLTTYQFWKKEIQDLAGNPMI